MSLIRAENILIHTFINDEWFDTAKMGLTYERNLDPELKKPVIKISNGLKTVTVFNTEDNWIGCDVHKDDLKALRNLNKFTGINIKYNIIEEM